MRHKLAKNRPGKYVYPSLEYAFPFLLFMFPFIHIFNLVIVDQTHDTSNTNLVC